jgi:hypothetical protein
MSQRQTTTKSYILVILFLILSSSLISAQENKNEITISGIAAHYIHNEKYHNLGPFNGYYKFPVDPGIEILFFRSLTKNTKLGTGLNFQKGRVASLMNGLRRFQFYEVAFPIIIQREFNLNEKIRLSLSSGVYTGVIPKINAQSPDKNENWHDYNSFDSDEKSSNDKWFADIYLTPCFSKPNSKFRDISFAPFVKYRINSTWLNYHQNKVHFGVKLSYTIGL